MVCSVFSKFFLYAIWERELYIKCKIQHPWLLIHVISCPLFTTKQDLTTYVERERERGRESINHISKSISKGFFLWVFARNRNRSSPAPSMNLEGRHPRTLISSFLIFLSSKVFCILRSPCRFQIDSFLPWRGNSSFHRNRSLYSLTRAISLVKKFSSYD